MRAVSRPGARRPQRVGLAVRTALTRWVATLRDAGGFVGENPVRTLVPRMAASDLLRVGDVAVIALADAHVDPSPWPLPMRFPHTPLEAFEPYRARYPSAFSQHGQPADTPSTFTCYVLRARGQTVLVDTGIGPFGTPISGMV